MSVASSAQPRQLTQQFQLPQIRLDALTVSITSREAGGTKRMPQKATQMYGLPHTTLTTPLSPAVLVKLGAVNAIGIKLPKPQHAQSA